MNTSIPRLSARDAYGPRRPSRPPTRGTDTASPRSARRQDPPHILRRHSSLPHANRIRFDNIFMVIMPQLQTALLPINNAHHSNPSLHFSIANFSFDQLFFSANDARRASPHLSLELRESFHDVVQIKSSRRNAASLPSLPSSRLPPLVRFGLCQDDTGTDRTIHMHEALAANLLTLLPKMDGASCRRERARCPASQHHRHFLISARSGAAID
ncbi:hypothetical protein IWZ01DRAFT_291498 [Phyllosticta capitalensis]